MFIQANLGKETSAHDHAVLAMDELNADVLVVSGKKQIEYERRDVVE